MPTVVRIHYLPPTAIAPWKGGMLTLERRSRVRPAPGCYQQLLPVPREYTPRKGEQPHIEVGAVSTEPTRGC